MINLNLLPEKYIKNRAPLLLMTSYIVGVVFSLIVILLFFVLLTISVRNQRNQASFKQLEQIKLTKNIKALKEANSVEVQETIKTLKSSQIFTNQIVKTLNDTFQKSQSELRGYELKLETDNGNDGARTFDNKEVIVLQLTGVAPYFAKMGVQKLLNDLAAIPWLYSAVLLNSTLYESVDDLPEAWSDANNIHEVTIQVKLIKEALPNNKELVHD